jgi:hypothetical protein
MKKPLIELPYSVKKLHLLIEIDPKNFPVCVTKEIKEWKWSGLKHKKFLAHNSGKSIEIYPVNSNN